MQLLASSQAPTIGLFAQLPLPSQAAVVQTFPSSAQPFVPVHTPALQAPLPPHSAAPPQGVPSICALATHKPDLASQALTAQPPALGAQVMTVLASTTH